MRMRILLIANYLPDGQQSMQRYAALLRDGLTKAGHEARVLLPSVHVGKLAQGPSGIKWLGYVDKLLLFPRELRKALEWAQVVHICDHSNAIYTKYVGNLPCLVTCHDMLAIRSALGEIPDYGTRWSGRRLQRMIFRGLTRARHIVCVSDATRADVLRLLPAGDREVNRIYNGLNYAWSPMAAEEAVKRLDNLGLPADQPFIVHVGGNQWYKNRLGVLKIFALFRRRACTSNVALVMAGKPWTEEMHEFAQSSDFKESMLELTNVDEEDLRALYSRAEALLFPSLAEGFGWPIAEAQSCGCPVVTSNQAPMTEVGGDAAVYIDPLDHAAAAAALANVIGSRSAIRAACDRNAARFSTVAMIDAYIGLYASIAGIGVPADSAAHDCRRFELPGKAPSSAEVSAQ